MRQTFPGSAGAHTVCNTSTYILQRLRMLTLLEMKPFFKKRTECHSNLYKMYMKAKIAHAVMSETEMFFLVGYVANT